jgi:four helix bundle protein
LDFGLGEHAPEIVDFGSLLFDLKKKPMDEKAFKDRTKKLALKVIAFAETLPKNRIADILSRQLIRSATSVGANYRAACRGKSKADVISKLGIVEEEADESGYWLELLVESGNVDGNKVANLLRETNEIVAMTVASIKTLRTRK